MTRWPDQLGQLYSLESEADSAAKALVALEKAQAAEQEDVSKFYRLDKLAAEYLLKAGATSGSPQLDSFGPNMSLAKDLLGKDQRESGDMSCAVQKEEPHGHRAVIDMTGRRGVRLLQRLPGCTCRRLQAANQLP